METNRLIKLLELLKKDLINGNPYDQTGMCSAIVFMYKKNLLSYAESEELEIYIHKNKPTSVNQYAEFTNSQYWVDFFYWWKPIDEEPNAKQIRLDYLTKLISNVK